MANLLNAFYSTSLSSIKNATVSINTIISEQQQQLQPEIQNQAELETLTQFLAGIGIVIGANILAVGIGVLSKNVLLDILYSRYSC
jgi:hypothetical protein